VIQLFLFRSSCLPFLLCKSSCHWSSCESDVDSG